MRRSIAVLVLPVAIGVAGAAMVGCTGPKPFIREGDANSVEIGYGGDVASTLPLARSYCARFERVPLLAWTGPDLAEYACVAR